MRGNSFAWTCPGRPSQSALRLWICTFVVALAGFVISPGHLRAQVLSSDEMAQKVQNPLADLKYIPFQENGDFGVGANNSYLNTLNFKPIWPLSVNDRWRAVSRTDFPVMFQEDVAPGVGNKWGLGDLTEELFFSPVNYAGSTRPMWGVGPALRIPTATSEFFGGGKWAIGPTAVVVKQTDIWTFGGLAQQLWSFTGDSARSDVSELFLQPFVSRLMGNGIALSANLEATRDWKQDTWNVPMNVEISKITTIGSTPVNVGGGVRFFLATPTDESGPDWGIRFHVTLIYPR